MAIIADQYLGALLGSDGRWVESGISFESTLSGRMVRYSHPLPDSVPIAAILPYQPLPFPLAVRILTSEDFDGDAIAANFRGQIRRSIPALITWCEKELVRAWYTQGRYRWTAPSPTEHDRSGWLESQGDLNDLTVGLVDDLLEQFTSEGRPSYQSGHGIWYSSYREVLVEKLEWILRDQCSIWIPPLGAPDPWSFAAIDWDLEFFEQAGSIVDNLAMADWSMVLRRHRQAVIADLVEARKREQAEALALDQLRQKLRPFTEQFLNLYQIHHGEPLGKLDQKHWEPVLLTVAQYQIPLDTIYDAIKMGLIPASNKVKKMVMQHP